MTDDAKANLISVKEAQGRLEFARPQQVHQLLKKCTEARVKDGKRTFIDWLVLEEWVAANPEHGVGQGPARKRKVTDFRTPEQLEEERIQAEAKGYPAPFERKPVLAMWDKGTYRGWAFGAVSACEANLVEFITQAAKKYHWVPLKVAASVADGSMFVLKPQEALRFIGLQLLRVKKDDPRFAEAIRLIAEAAKLLDEIQNDLEDADDLH